MQTIIGIVAAVISGIIVRFVFELLLDAYIRPRRHYHELRGKVSFEMDSALQLTVYLSDLHDALFKDIGAPITPLDIDNFQHNTKETIFRLQQLSSQIAAFYETYKRPIPGVPRGTVLQHVIHEIWKLCEIIEALRKQDPYDKSSDTIKIFNRMVEPINKIKKMLGLRDSNEL